MPLTLNASGDDGSSDAVLVSLARDGSTDAIGALYDRYAAGLLVIAHRLLQSRDDARDVVHDVSTGNQGLPQAPSRSSSSRRCPGADASIPPRAAQPRRAASIVAMSIFCICIITSNARLAAAGFRR